MFGVVFTLLFYVERRWELQNVVHILSFFNLSISKTFEMSVISKLLFYVVERRLELQNTVHTF